jgi:putative hydrolase of the HAD superfamily
MAGGKKKLIIFDIGGVLVNFSELGYIRYLHRNVLPDISVTKLERFIMPLVPLMDYGTLSVPTLEHMIAEHFGISKLDLRWVQGYMAVASPRKAVIRLLNRLAGEYRVVLLSNISPSRYAEMSGTYLKDIRPERVFLSFELRMRKPEPGIYRCVLKETGAKPKDTMFIDNQIENVIAAEREGIDSIWFRGYDKLIKELKGYGIKA